MNKNSPFFIVGDLHGYLDKLVRLLRFAGLANAKGEWMGGDAQLWFIGDFTDRGPDGIGVIDFVMRLQQDARAKGGHVGALLGNHDVGLLSARLFPHAPTHGPRGTFYGDWIEFGGIASDLARLESQHVEWLQNLPAMALVQERLLIHADALYYLNYGETIAEVNAATTRLLHDDSPERWDQLLGYAGERLVFSDQRPDGRMRARQFLAQFGGKQIIHGHTPIHKLSGEAIARVTRAYVYADNLVVDVDGGIYQGGTGFVYQAPPLTESTISTQQMSAR
jgi:hypothetical protein